MRLPRAAHGPLSLVGAGLRRSWDGLVLPAARDLALTLELRVSQLLDRAVPQVTAELLDRLDLTDVVLERVDLDRVVAAVDLDAAAARLDVEEFVSRLDLTRLVLDHVDLDAIVATVDLDAAAARLDVEEFVSRLDLTRLVLDHVDLDAIVATADLDAAARRLDVDAVIARLDLAGIAEDVIAAIDLPEIIRESTGSVGSETVRGVRMQGINGDEAVARLVERLRVRRHRDGAVPPPRTPSSP